MVNTKGKTSSQKHLLPRSSSLLVHLILQLFLVCQSNASETLDEFTQSLQINLVQELNLHNFSYSGLSTDRSHSFPNAIYLYDDSSRNVRLNSQVCQRAARLISQGNDVTFLATIRQIKGNIGALFAFTDGIHRVLEIQSSGRRKELRFQYRQHETVFTETFEVDLADDAWHKIALTVSDVQLDLYIDCVHRFQRQILPIDKETLLKRNLTLWLGQRGLHHFMYQGYLRDVRIVSSANAFRAQCPDLETACPTCGQFRALKDSIFRLESTVKHLTEKLRAIEQRMENVESCDCVKGCRINGTVYPDGFVWRQNCDNCTCSAGKVTCKKIKCENSCRNAQQQDVCCPKCKKQCYQKGRGKLNEGDRFVELNARKTKCNQCVCDKDGKLNCREIATEKCPKLNCTNQIRPDDQCCNICEGTDFCSQGHSCHKNAECRNLRTNYTCVCKAGFRGNGHTCEDIDECADQNHRCINADCVNKIGSYECRCKSGFSVIDQHRCIDIDECSTEQHMCGENAVCFNTQGHYQCKCKEGYDGDGRMCKPVCKHSCLNGGQCVAPNICSCRKGYYGHRCEADIDECELGLHQCPANSKCINKPGWYNCECNQGYETYKEPFDTNTHEFQCRDIDECSNPLLNTCPSTSKCVNFDGSYRCECNHTNLPTKTSQQRPSATCSTCVVNGVEYEHEQKWSLSSEHCTTCHCLEGVVTCEQPKCDCSNSSSNSLCCPHCHHDRICLHQEDRNTVFKSGERWNYDCQTCECMNGEIDCWSECPPVNCLHPIRIPGDCCFRCDDDPCQSPVRFSNSTMAGCRHFNKEYRSGQVVTLPSDKCTSCLCQVPQVLFQQIRPVRMASSSGLSLTHSGSQKHNRQYSVKGPNYDDGSPFDANGHYIEHFLDKEHNFGDNRLDRDYESDDNGDSSNSHEFSFSDKKKLPPNGERNSYRPVKGTDKREENDRQLDDLLPDWSHELATT